MVWSMSLMMKQHLVKNKQSLMSMMTLLAHFLFVFKGSSLLVFQHPSFSTNQVALKRLTKMKKSLSSIDETVTGLGSDSDNTYLVHQYQEQMSYLKEMSDVNTRLLSLMLEYDDELLVCGDEAEKSMFDCSLKVKKALHSQHGMVLLPP